MSPAGLGGAAPAHAVTLAQGPHGLPDRHPPRLAVVEVGQGPGVGPSLAAVQELPAHLLPELDVVAAAAPLPLGHVPLGANPPGLTLTMLKQINPSDFFLDTDVCTDHQGSLAAVPGEGVGHGRRGDGLDVGRLPVVPPLLPPGPEGGDGAVPDLGPELVSTLTDGQLRPGGYGGGQGQISLKTEKISIFVGYRLIEL